MGRGLESPRSTPSQSLVTLKGSRSIIAVLRFYAYNAELAEGAARGVSRAGCQRAPGYPIH
jgi:hypothetical protein